MENDIRHVTVFLSLAITIRLGPTDIILDNNRRKNLVNHSSRSFLPRFSSPKHREKSIRSNNASIIERRIDPPPILTRLDSPTHLCNADVYVFSSPPLFCSFDITPRDCDRARSVRLIGKFIEPKCFRKNGWKRGEIVKRKFRGNRSCSREISRLLWRWTFCLWDRWRGSRSICAEIFAEKETYFL